MKKWLLNTMMLMMMLLAACTPRIYGVPQESWETMSEQERISAMEAYKARQEVLRQQREEQARLRAMEKEAQLAREAEEAHQRQLQVDAIYRGKGLYGDLLRVTLEGGMLQFYGAHKPFQAVSFKIAAGETKNVEVVSTQGRKARLAVCYDGSNLLLDETTKSHRSTALRLPYEDSWETGATYLNRFAKGPLEMRGVNVTVRIVGEPPRDHHGRRHRPQVVVVRPPAQQPKPAVIVIKKPEHRPQPNGVVIEKRPPSKRPDIVAHRPNNYNEDTEYAAAQPARIKVVFLKGQLVAKKHGHPQDPRTIYLYDGQIRNVIMRSQSGELKIQVRYLKGELLIDDTTGRGKTQTRLGFVPSWKDGQRYIIETGGNRLLENLDILVMSQ